MPQVPASGVQLLVHDSGVSFLSEIIWNMRVMTSMAVCVRLSTMLNATGSDSSSYGRGGFHMYRI